MRKRLHDQGFTLIELLVVITIIAILASISVPVYNSVTERAKITRVLSNVKQINLACRTYAIDNDGLFPQGSSVDENGAPKVATTSTEAFKELVPNYVGVESIFFTAGQAGTAAKRSPNENNVLDSYENCFAYVVGLNDSSPGNTPLIADWFTKSIGVYDATHVWWSSGKAVVGRADGSASAETLIKTPELTAKVQGVSKGSDLFGVRGETGESGLIPVGAKVVNP